MTVVYGSRMSVAKIGKKEASLGKHLRCFSSEQPRKPPAANVLVKTATRTGLISSHRHFITEYNTQSQTRGYASYLECSLNYVYGKITGTSWISAIPPKKLTGAACMGLRVRDFTLVS